MSFIYTPPPSAIAGGVTYKGTFDASTGLPDLSNAEQGDMYVVSVAGTIYGQTWAVGDHLLINEDMGGSITNSKIDKVDNTDLVTSVNGLVGTVVLSGDDIAADHTASNYTATNANIDGHLSGIDSALGAAAPVDSVNGKTGVVNIYADDTTLNIAGSGLTISGTAATSTLNADVRTVNGATGAVVLSGDDIAADHTASNYTATNANIDGHLAGIDTALGVAAPVDSVNGQTGVVNIYADDSTLNLAGSGLTISGTGATSTLNADVTSVNGATGGVNIYADDSTLNLAGSGLTITGTGATSTLNADVTSVNGATGAVSLGINDLSDVDTTGITNTQLLAYNSTLGNFQPASPTSVPDATDNTKGIIEIATDGEAAAGSLGDKALVPSNISSFVIASSKVTGLATVATSGAYADLSGKPTTATTATEGIIATATDGETTIGTADNKALTPANIDAIGLGQLSNVSLSGVAANDFLKYSGSEFEPTTDGTALTIEVVSDTSPQLGGNLDVQTNEIVSSSNNDIVIAPNGTGSIVVKDEKSIKFNESTNTYSVSIAAPNTLAASYSLTWPLNDGDNGQLLQTNGSGVTSWTGPHLLAASNLSDLDNAATARTNLSAQQQDAGLDSIAGLTTAADKMIYTTGADTYAVTDLTSQARNLLDDATAADQRTTLGLVAVASSGNASDVTSAVNPTNYTKASNDVDGHLSGIDSKLGTILTLPTYETVVVGDSPVTGAVNYHYSVDTSGGAIEIDLPAISGATTGQRIYIKLKTAGNDLTLDPSGSDTIDGQSSYVLDVQHSAITLVVGAGSNWEII